MPLCIDLFSTEDGDMWAAEGEGSSDLGATISKGLDYERAFLCQRVARIRHQACAAARTALECLTRSG
jgi:hypothetical protein